MQSNIEPMGVDQQLERLREEYTASQAPVFGKSRIYDPLYTQWAELEAHSTNIRNCLPSITRGAVHDNNAPLHEAMQYIMGGLYPPPELLVVIAEAYQRYMQARGDMALEAAFFGPVQRNTGNWAGRNASRIRSRYMAIRMGMEMQQGATKAEAAEKLAALGFPRERLLKLTIPGHQRLRRNDAGRRKAARRPAHTGATWSEMAAKIGI